MQLIVMRRGDQEVVIPVSMWPSESKGLLAEGFQFSEVRQIGASGWFPPQVQSVRVISLGPPENCANFLLYRTSQIARRTYERTVVLVIVLAGEDVLSFDFFPFGSYELLDWQEFWRDYQYGCRCLYSPAAKWHADTDSLFQPSLITTNVEPDEDDRKYVDEWYAPDTRWYKNSGTSSLPNFLDYYEDY